MQEIFDTLGFKEEEVKVYLALLKNGSASASDIAKKVARPRPTVYTYLESLIQGGLVSKSLRNGVKIFVPEPTERLRFLYDRKIEDLKHKKKRLETVIPELEKHIGLNLARPRLQFFEGRHEVENAHMDMLSYSNMEVRVFWSHQAALNAISEEFFWYYNKERIKKNLFVKGIWSPTQIINTKRYPFMSVGKEMKREVRIAPETLSFSMSCRIYANKVLYFSSNIEQFCFILESAEFSETIASQHETIWDISTPHEATKISESKPFLDDLDKK